jgi:hypothetical protein
MEQKTQTKPSPSAISAERPTRQEAAGPSPTLVKTSLRAVSIVAPESLVSIGGDSADFFGTAAGSAKFEPVAIGGIVLK